MILWSEIAVIVIAVLGLALLLASTAARRLDRLHRKVVSSRLALDSQLLRRATATQELATAGVLDPVSSVLLAETSRTAVVNSDAGDRELLTAVPDLMELVAAHRDVAASEPAPRLAVMQALDAGLGAEREELESNLTAVVEEILESSESTRELYSDPYTSSLLNDVSSAWYRVQIARRFHNESVLQAQRIRAKWWVRTLRLAGYAPMPHTVEFDDSWPDGLRQPNAELAAGQHSDSDVASSVSQTFEAGSRTTTAAKQNAGPGDQIGE